MSDDSNLKWRVIHQRPYPTSDRHTWEAVEQKVRENKGHQRQWPENEHDPPRCHIAGLRSVEGASPVPQGRNPNLLRALYDASTQRPNLGGSALPNTSDMSNEVSKKVNAHRFLSEI